MMFGILIGDIRRNSGISTSELASGLCSEGMLRKYETGQREPEKLLADALFQRLGKSMDKYDIMLDADEYALAAARVVIPKMLSEGRLQEAEEALNAYLKAPGVQEKPLHRQFVALHRAELRRKQKAPDEEQRQLILYGLRQTLGEEADTLKPEILQKRRFCLMEIYLLQRYACVCEQQDRELEALLWHQGILNYLRPKTEYGKKIEYDKTDVRKIYPFSAYCLAEKYAGAKQFNEALELIEESCALLGLAKNQSALFARTMELKFQVLCQMGKQPARWERNCLNLMYEAVGPNRALWWEDWYPVYLELQIHSVNEIIRERRIVHGMTEEDLALEICDARTVMRIENGQCMPRKKTRDLLLGRLGMSTEKYDGGIVTGKYSDYKKYTEIVQCFMKKDYWGMKEKISELKNSMSEQYITNYQFLTFWTLLAKRKAGELKAEKYEQALCNLLLHTLPIKELNLIVSCELLKYERESIRELGWNNHRKDFKVDELIHRKYIMLSAHTHKKLLFRSFYRDIICCYGMEMLRQGKYDKAKLLLQKEIMDGFLLHDDIQINRLMTTCFWSEEQLSAPSSGTDSDFFFWIRCAYAVSSIYLNDKIMMKYLEEYVREKYPQNGGLFSDLRPD